MSVPQHGHNANTATASELSQAAKRFAHLSWAYTDDRPARTRKARETFQASFLEQTKTPECPEGDPLKAESLRKAFYAGLALKSAASRRRNRANRENGAA